MTFDDPNARTRPAGTRDAIADDRRLAQAARRGDVAAFEALYRRHVARVHGLCRRLAGDRAVFVLHDVEGWRHREIAALTGTAVGTVKAQLRRARALLREFLGSSEG